MKRPLEFALCLVSTIAMAGIIGVVTYNVTADMRKSTVNAVVMSINAEKSKQEHKSDNKSTETIVSDSTLATESVDTKKGSVIIDKDGKKTYYIKPGDTLCDISRATGFSVDELAEYNDIRDVNLIYAKSVLRVPDTKPNTK